MGKSKEKKRKRESSKERKKSKKEKVSDSNGADASLTEASSLTEVKRSSCDQQIEATQHAEVCTATSVVSDASPPPSANGKSDDADNDDDDNGSNHNNGNSAISKKERKKQKKRERKEKKAREKNLDAEDRLKETEEADGLATTTTEKAKKKKLKKEKKKEKKKRKSDSSSSDPTSPQSKDEKIVSSSALDFHDEQIIEKQIQHQPHNISLLLFYQYVEPQWDEQTYNAILQKLTQLGKDLELTGRMRVAREGLNCTLTGTYDSIMDYCGTLRNKLYPQYFESTEFKLTHDLPRAQRFPNLKVFPVVELVHYGLEGKKAPPIARYQGTHLEPKDYHQKLGESNTVIIDVRNHYEAAIGHFCPPQNESEKVAVPENSNGSSSGTNDGDGGKDAPPPEWVDPKMRKSTEFPAWLNKAETKEKLKGKQVLMYCTGGIRCERASALLKYKMDNDPDIKNLDIKGVFQLQGGIDKYFKEFPEGGYWKGKNYVFDKRFAHAPPKVDGENHSKKTGAVPDSNKIMGKCEACRKPWDMYRGKRRCPTCGVPSLICKECFLADKEGRRKLGREVRCDLCVEQNIKSKREWREQEQQEIKAYERELDAKGLLRPEEGSTKVANPDNITRLLLKNMCRKKMDEATLVDSIPGITHLVWRKDGRTGRFMGQGWIEMASPDDAARAVARSGTLNLFGRPLYMSFQAPGGKDVWPPPNSRVA